MFWIGDPDGIHSQRCLEDIGRLGLLLELNVEISTKTVGLHTFPSEGLTSQNSLNIVEAIQGPRNILYAIQ